MKRVSLFFLTLVMGLAFTTCAYATSFDLLKTDYSQGGNPTVVRGITGSGQLYTGPCRIISASMFSSAAGDIVAIYNTVGPALPITDLEFEMGIAANYTNSPPCLEGAAFDKGIYVQSTNAASITTVVFDY